MSINTGAIPIVTRNSMAEKFVLIQNEYGKYGFFMEAHENELADANLTVVERNIGLACKQHENITNLRWLPIVDSAPNHDGVIWQSEFPSFLNSLFDLESLEMSMFFKAEGDEVFTVDLQHLCRLTHLDLSNNCLQVMPENLSRLVNLRVLNISHNNFLDIDTDFSGMQQLTHLFIDSGSIPGDVEYRSINYSICALLNLKVLSFNMTRLISLPYDIGKLENLTSLNIQGSCLDELPESISNLTNLVELLAYGLGLQSLSENFGNLSKLETLELKGNCDVLTLPRSFLQLTQLTDLSLPGKESLVKPVGYESFLCNLTLNGCKYEESDY